MAARAMASAHLHAAAAAWIPSNAAGLVFWIDASDAASITHVANAVSQINDKSGNANHAVQATAAAKPTLGTDATTGRGKLGFDGGDHLAVADHATLDLTTGLTLFVACNLTAFTPYGIVVGKDSTAFTAAYTLASGDPGGTTDLRMYVNSTVAKVATASTYTSGRHVLAGAYDSATIRGFFDSTTALATTVYTAPATVNTTPLTVGDRAEGTYGVTGDIYEILLYNSDIGATERANALSYLRTKWATP